MSWENAWGKQDFRRRRRLSKEPERQKACAYMESNSITLGRENAFIDHLLTLRLRCVGKSREVVWKGFKDSDLLRSILRKEAKDRPMRLPVAWQPLRSKAGMEGQEAWLQETTPG